MRQITLLLLVLVPLLRCAAQADISAYPPDYASGTVLSRMIDALGFRYHWATHGLREEDLAFRPVEGARSSYETLEHIYGLSEMVLSAARRDTLGGGQREPYSDFSNLRRRTLERLSEASTLFRGLSDAEIADRRLRLSSGNGYAEYPIWNLIHGPLADAIYHTGQLVSFRRMTDNPANPRVNHFRGSVAQ